MPTSGSRFFWQLQQTTLSQLRPFDYSFDALAFSSPVVMNRSAPRSTTTTNLYAARSQGYPSICNVRGSSTRFRMPRFLRNQQKGADRHKRETRPVGFPLSSPKKPNALCLLFFCGVSICTVSWTGGSKIPSYSAGVTLMRLGLSRFSSGSSTFLPTTQKCVQPRCQDVPAGHPVHLRPCPST